MAKASTKRLFTPQLIERLSPEKGRRVEIMDSNCPGLVLRVTEGGVRTFGVLYRVAGKGGVGGRGKPLMGPQQRFTLGKYPRIGAALITRLWSWAPPMPIETNAHRALT